MLENGRRQHASSACDAACAPPRRAARFGTEYKEPERREDLRLEARRERHRKPGFKTGLDIFSAVGNSSM